jgi:hypothetical protein
MLPRGKIYLQPLRDSQLNPIVRRVYQILLRPEVPFGRLNGGVAQQQLDLLQLATRRST